MSGDELRDSLDGAVRSFKASLEARDLNNVRRFKESPRISLGAWFESRLKFQERGDEKPADPPLMGPECSIDNASVIFNGVSGTDFGFGTSRPLQMAYENYLRALSQLAGDSGFCPLTVHSLAFELTPPCDNTGHLAISSPSIAQAIRVSGSCFASSSTAFGSMSDGNTFTDPSCPSSDPDSSCPDSCTQRTASWGGSASIDEQLDFGNVAVAESSWADVASGSAIVWVSYAFSASAEWECSFSGCESIQGPETQCVDADGNSCGPAGSGSSGEICANVIGVGDPRFPPIGASSSIALQFSGPGWATGAGVLSLFFGPATSPDPLGNSCASAATFTY